MTSPDSKLPDEYTQDAETMTSSDKLRVALEIAIAALILAAIYYFFAPEEEIDLAPPLEESQIDPIIKAQIDSATEQTAPVDDEVDTAEKAEIVDHPSPFGELNCSGFCFNCSVFRGGSARALISSLRSGETALNPEQILSQATAYQNEGKLTDAYLLLFYAAREGDAAAAFSLASLHDPNHFNDGNPLLENPDPYQAHKWYSAAADKGLTKADERLRILRKTTEEQAKKGDLAAKRLLLNWR